MRRSLLLPLAPLVLLAACHKNDEGASIAVTTGNGSGGSMDAGGKVKIDTPLFQGTFKVPEVKLDAKNFDIDGVHLYPGSKISAVNVDAAQGDGRVVVRFDSPAAPAAVRDWLATEFKKAGKSVETAGEGLKGKDDEGKTFTIDLTPAGDATSGTIHLG